MSQTAPRRLALIAPALALVLLALAPVALAVPPSGSFTFTPAPPDRPNVNEEITFQAGEIDWGGDAGTVTWLFGDGTTGAGPSATHAYGAAGAKPVAMVLTNGADETTPVTQTIQVNGPPAAAFAFAPSSPTPGEDILFASDAADPDGDPLVHQWDFGDGVTSPLRNPTHSFALVGSKTVTLTVTDPYGASASETHEVVVVGPLVNTPDPPSAGFAFSPRTPEVGDPVDFASSSFAQSGMLTEQRWDLDNDGQFDDGRGEEVLYTFLTAGQKKVRLRVEDSNGLSAVKERTLTVAEPPKPAPGLLSPAPRVRLSGEILASGTRVRVLEVRAPRAALVRVACHGKGCKAKQRRKRIKRSSLRFRGYEHFIRAGSRLEVFIRKGDTIGSYIRYTIRAGKAPKRVDRCLYPGVEKQRKCPS